MRAFLIFLILSSNVILVCAQSVLYNPGTESMSTANALLYTGIKSQQGNINKYSTLDTLRSLRLGIESAYLLIPRVQASYFRSNSQKSYGLYFIQEGIEGFKYNRLSTHYAKELFNDFDAGLSVSYVFSSGKENRSYNSLLIPELGFSYAITSNLYGGFQYAFVFGHESLRTSYENEGRVNLTYHDESVVFGTSLFLIDKEAFFTFCAEYTLHDRVGFRASFQTRESLVSGGLLFLHSKFTHELAINYHPYLGISPGYSLVYAF